MNKKKLIISLSIIGIVAAIAIGGTIAYFSDVETSVGNKFVAGKFNLKIDNTCHYNGKVCSYYDSNNGFTPGYYWNGDPTQEPCFCTWEEKDLAGELYFNLLDVKPGDNGEDTISLHVDNNPAWVCAEVANLVDQDNDCESPENKVDTTCGNPGIGEGELQNNLFFTVWKDTNCDNILDNGEQVLVQDQPAQAGIWPIADSQHGPAIPGGATICYGVKWNVPIETTNIIQTDSLVGNVIFTAVQSRNMESFLCSPAGPCAPTTETCNGLDDDCDQQIDEGNPGGGGVCTTGLQGICSAGTLTCTTGALSCVQNQQAVTEICGNGLDDDCDGTVDEGCTVDADGDGYASDADCNDTNSNIYPGTPELCNGLDDDCDLTIDEDFPTLGAACDGADTDLCQEGAFVCSGGGQICSDATGDTIEVCGNGVDDDCDGSVDEGCVACVPITEICGDGIDQNCNGSDLACTPQCTSDANCPMPNNCTIGACQSGLCVYTSHNEMCNDINSCTIDYCNSQTGCVYNMTANVGTSCTNLTCLLGGSCNGWTCSGIGACVAPAVPPGGCASSADCNDGNSCTSDSCSGNACQHVNLTSLQCPIFGGTCTGGNVTCNPNPNCPNNCDDSNFCTIDSCALTGCTNTIKTCDDGNEFTYDACDPTNGQCSNFPLPTFEYSPCFVLPWGGQWCFGD